ncbi:MAG TPA: hypothetical protein PLJ84_00305 [Bacteroidales bacterium]|nr:hypothetical protein [Bacteroidales bacterium]HPT01010.1 hypothetical protein [Bacteroidales bacterium]
MIDYSEEFNELLIMQDCFVQNSGMFREMRGQNCKTAETITTAGENPDQDEMEFAFSRAWRDRANDDDL